MQYWRTNLACGALIEFMRAWPVDERRTGAARRPKRGEGTVASRKARSCDDRT